MSCQSVFDLFVCPQITSLFTIRFMSCQLRIYTNFILLQTHTERTDSHKTACYRFCPLFTAPNRNPTYIKSQVIAYGSCTLPPSFTRRVTYRYMYSLLVILENHDSVCGGFCVQARALLRTVAPPNTTRPKCTHAPLLITHLCGSGTCSKRIYTYQPPMPVI